MGARNYELVTARAGDELVGFVFGYSLRQDRDWFAGLQPAPEEGFTDERGGERTVVLAEIEVRKAWQGRGIGRGLHDSFLRGRREERATLSADPAATATHALYEGWGWQRVGTVPGRPGAYYREVGAARPDQPPEGSGQVDRRAAVARARRHPGSPGASVSGASTPQTARTCTRRSFVVGQPGGRSSWAASGWPGRSTQSRLSSPDPRTRSSAPARSCCGTSNRLRPTDEMWCPSARVCGRVLG